MVKQITTFQRPPHSSGFHVPAPLLETMLSHSWRSQRNSEIPRGTSQINGSTEMQAHYTPWGGDEEQNCSQASFKAFNCFPPLSITELNTTAYSSEVLLKPIDAFHRYSGSPVYRQCSVAKASSVTLICVRLHSKGTSACQPSGFFGLFWGWTAGPWGSVKIEGKGKIIYVVQLFARLTAGKSTLLCSSWR